MCVPLTAFHLMVSPVEMRTVVGDQWLTIPFTVFVARVGVWRPFATAPVAATTVKMRNATRTSDVRMRRIDIRTLPFDSRMVCERCRYYGRARGTDCVSRAPSPGLRVVAADS